MAGARAVVAGNRRHRLADRIGQQDPRPLHALRRFGPRAGDPLENPAGFVLDDEPGPSALKWHPQSPQDLKEGHLYRTLRPICMAL